VERNFARFASEEKSQLQFMLEKIPAHKRRSKTVGKRSFLSATDLVVDSSCSLMDIVSAKR
jgi:hypothetical protein